MPLPPATPLRPHADAPRRMRPPGRPVRRHRGGSIPSRLSAEEAILRIALVIERFLPTGGGVENVAWQVAHELARQGADVTVLARENQHELCVLARKFGNLHVYGCWWFCNNPSIIEQTTRMRLEMMGAAFTCQHSDARVLDQLLYKWDHSREAVTPALTDQYARLLRAGWEVRDEDVQRDVHQLFGGAYEDFMAK